MNNFINRILLLFVLAIFISLNTLCAQNGNYSFDKGLVRVYKPLSTSEIKDVQKSIDEVLKSLDQIPDLKRKIIISYSSPELNKACTRNVKKIIRLMKKHYGIGQLNIVNSISSNSQEKLLCSISVLIL